MKTRCPINRQYYYRISDDRSRGVRGRRRRRPMRSPGLPGARLPATPAYQAPKAYAPEPDYPPAPYSFEYSVNDPTTYDVKSQSEYSDGKTVKKATTAWSEPTAQRGSSNSPPATTVSTPMSRRKAPRHTPPQHTKSRPLTNRPTQRPNTQRLPTNHPHTRHTLTVVDHVRTLRYNVSTTNHLLPLDRAKIFVIEILQLHIPFVQRHLK